MPDNLTPHGPGFSFVDSFVTVEPGLVVQSRKWLDPALPFFADHFPGAPLMPGVLLIESAAQTAGLLWGSHLSDNSQPRFALAQVLNFKIQRPVLPDQTIEVRAELDRDFGTLAQFTVEIREQDQVVATGRIILAKDVV
jgi:3-hydroxyacyl-[acyl-carrier-protein] dehydratase